MISNNNSKKSKAGKVLLYANQDTSILLDYTGTNRMRDIKQ